jgi:thiamine-phosphate pyrophosphorylase
MRHNVAALVRLMLVTDDRMMAGRDLVHLAQSAQQGGITSLQVRLKELPAQQLVKLVQELVTGLDIPVLVNDRPDVALAAGAAGVHLGPDDVSVGLVRRIAPPEFVVGASVGNESEAGASGNADYWGVGPWRTSPTKEDAGSGLGPDGFRTLVELSQGKPCVAIGGIRPEDGPAVVAMGGAGVAVVSGILGAEDVAAAARRYWKSVNRQR